MITLARVGDVVRFTFQDNPLYLNNGTIEVPVNSLSLLIDESNIATFKKAASNDIFLSCSLDELGMTRTQLINWYKDNMVDEGITPEEVEDIVESATTNLFGYAEYDSQNIRINFKHDASGSVISSIDASDFVIDGMIDNVEIVTVEGVKYLKITFNTESGKEPILIPLADIFNPDNYYTKTATDALLAEKANTATTYTKTETNTLLAAKADTATTYTKTEVNNAISAATSGKVDTDVFDEKERAVSIALNDLNTRKLDASAYTPTDLSNYYTKSETDGEIEEALSGKADTSAVTEAISAAVSGKADSDSVYTKTETDSALSGKQDTLVSGTNIKTINNTSILGSGNIDIQGGGGKAVSGGTNISITTGETADTINCTLPITKNRYNNGVTLGWDGNNSLNYFAVAEGYSSKAKGASSHAEGYDTTANTQGSHSEGYKTIAGLTIDSYSQEYCHAEGYETSALTYFSHTEGYRNKVQGQASHAEGANNEINNPFGNYTQFSLVCSHAEGKNNKTYNEAEHASGQYNNSVSASTTFGDSGNTLFSVGNGTADNTRHNAFEIRQNGDIYLTKDGQDVKLQDQLGGGGSSYTAGDGIDITNDVISVTGKVDTSAITTSMTSGSTDLQVPSAKAVYDNFGGLKLVKLTQAQYNALAVKDPMTLYVIADDVVCAPESDAWVTVGSEGVNYNKPVYNLNLSGTAVSEEYATSSELTHSISFNLYSEPYTGQNFDYVVDVEFSNVPMAESYSLEILNAAGVLVYSTTDDTENIDLCQILGGGFYLDGTDLPSITYCVSTECTEYECLEYDEETGECIEEGECISTECTNEVTTYPLQVKQ